MWKEWYNEAQQANIEVGRDSERMVYEYANKFLGARSSGIGAKFHRAFS